MCSSYSHKCYWFEYTILGSKLGSSKPLTTLDDAQRFCASFYRTFRLVLNRAKTIAKTHYDMGKAKKTRKFAAVKRMINNKKQQTAQTQTPKPEDPELTRLVPQVSLALFFKYNAAIKPPYQVLIDTNFINFSIQKKIDIVRGLMDCLLAKCIPIITDCVMAELEKLGPKYRIALKLAKDPRIQRLLCSHKGTYADDCLVNRVMQHKCYIVATNDADLKRRIRKVPGIPLMLVGGKAYVIERLPDVF